MSGSNDSLEKKAAPIYDEVETPGYLSSNARKRHFLITSLALGMYFLFQIIVSLGGQYWIMPGGVVRFTFAHVREAVFWKGKIWYPESSIELTGGQSTELRAIDLKSMARDDTRAFMPANVTSFLATDDLLWAIGKNIAFVESPVEPDATNVAPSSQLENIVSPPFLYQGSPSVIQVKNGLVGCWSFTDGQWQQTVSDLRIEFDRPLTPPANRVQFAFADQLKPREIQVVSVGTDTTVFALRPNGSINYRDAALTELAGEGVDLDFDWHKLPFVSKQRQLKPNQPLSSKLRWTAVALDGQSYVFALDKPVEEDDVATLVGLRRSGDKWEEFAEYSLIGNVADFAICATGEPGRMVILTQGKFGESHLFVVENGGITQSKRLGNVVPFLPEQSLNRIMYIILLYTCAIVIVVIGITLVMHVHRDTDYRFAPDSFPYASLLRRGIARAIDNSIASVPILICFVWLFSETDVVTFFVDLFANRNALWRRHEAPLTGLLITVIFSFCWFFALCYMEGRWARTPGKLLCGIRVVKLDLSNCGFGWAFIRRFLIFLDAFFGHIVGIAMIAMMRNRQRIGDVAAGTIMLRAKAVDEWRRSHSESDVLGKRDVPIANDLAESDATAANDAAAEE